LAQVSGDCYERNPYKWVEGELERHALTLYLNQIQIQFKNVFQRLDWFIWSKPWGSFILRWLPRLVLDHLPEPASGNRELLADTSYGFHSHANFETVNAEFEAVGLIDGNVVARLEDTQKIDDPSVSHDASPFSKDPTSLAL